MSVSAAAGCHPVLHGRVGRRPELLLAVGGAAASCAIVLLDIRVGPAGLGRPYGTWLGLAVRTHLPSFRHLLGALLLVAVLALIAAWLAALRAARTGALGARGVWRLAAIWSVPLLLGPPVFSSDVYAYVADGMLARRDLSVYRYGPVALGHTPAALAVDHLWRHSTSPYGPLQSLVEHSAAFVARGNLLVALYLLRAASTVGVIAIGLLAAHLAGPRLRSGALVLTVLNPLLLLQVLAPAHVEALMCALLLAALVAARHQRWSLAVAFGCLAGSLKAPAFLAVFVVLLAHAATTRGRARMRAVALDTGIAAVTVAGCAVLVPHGFGWISALRTPARGYTFDAPTSLLTNLARRVLPATGGHSIRTEIGTGMLAAAAVLVLLLLLTARRRSVDRTTGFALLAVALLGPVLYPWYLAWGLVCLAPRAGRRMRPVLVGLSALACLASPAALPRRWVLGITAAAALAVIAAVWITVRRTDRRSATVGDAAWVPGVTQS